MSVFNDIRKVLLDPTSEGQVQRKGIKEASGVIKGCSGLAMYVCGTITALSVWAMREYPLIGGFFALIGAAGTVGAHEVKVLSGNAESMLSGDGIIGNVVNRAKTAWSEQNFVDRITQDTWIVGPLFKATIISGLEKAK